MTASPVLLDTNLLVLLVAGKSNRDLVSSHRRLSAFSPADYDTLLEFLDGRDLVLLPNTLTEASNLLSQVKEPQKSQMRGFLRELIWSEHETLIASADAAHDRDYLRLGLTDSAILRGMTAGVALLTADAALYLEAARRGHKAYNFSHLRSPLD